MPELSFGEAVVYTGRLLAPIFLWLSVFAIMKSYIKRSNWSFQTRICLYLCLAFACILFLLVAHVFVKVPHQQDAIACKK